MRPRCAANNARKEPRWKEGRDQNPYTKHVMGDAHQPWCAAYVSTMLEQANIPGVSKKMFSASAAGLAGQFQGAKPGATSRGARRPRSQATSSSSETAGPSTTPASCRRSKNGKGYTIEGNSSDKVSERVILERPRHRRLRPGVRRGDGLGRPGSGHQRCDERPGWRRSFGPRAGSGQLWAGE